MNYQKHYDALIERARNRQLPEDLYVERHHIQPHCMGGSDDDSNLVKLTAEEHYVAHQLLTKIHPKHRGLIYAACMMSVNNPSSKRNNKIYGWLRRKYSEARKGQPSPLKGRKLSEETKRKISEATKGRKLSKIHCQKITAALKRRSPMSKETRYKMSQAAKGRKHSKEAKQKMRESALKRAPMSNVTKQKLREINLGRKHTPEHCQKISESLTGKPLSESHKQKLLDAWKQPGRRDIFNDEYKQKMSESCKKIPKLTCPNCDITCSPGMAKRYHFDKCKSKKCPHCDEINGPKTSERYHFDNCKHKSKDS